MTLPEVSLTSPSRTTVLLIRWRAIIYVVLLLLAIGLVALAGGRSIDPASETPTPSGERAR